MLHGWYEKADPDCYWASFPDEIAACWTRAKNNLPAGAIWRGYLCEMLKIHQIVPVYYRP